MASTFTAQLILSLFLCLLTASAHEMKFGSCPRVEVMQQFDFQKMLGIWYVIQKTKSSSTCTYYDFIEYENGGRSLKESSRPLGIDMRGFVDPTQYGPLRTPNPSVAAKMTVAFPYSILPHSQADFWILDTDYETYALTFSCRKIAFSSRQSAMILSREETLDRRVIDKLRDRLEYFGINSRVLSNIKQRGCQHPPNALTPTTKETATTEHSYVTITIPTTAPTTSTQRYNTITIPTTTPFPYVTITIPDQSPPTTTEINLPPTTRTETEEVTLVEEPETVTEPRSSTVTPPEEPKTTVESRPETVTTRESPETFTETRRSITTTEAPPRIVTESDVPSTTTTRATTTTNIPTTTTTTVTSITTTPPIDIGHNNEISDK